MTGQRKNKENYEEINNAKNNNIHMYMYCIIIDDK